MDDAALLAAFVRDRSEEAFQELVRRHIGVVYAACRRQLRDAHWAEDVTQAVFVLLAKKAPELAEGRGGTVLGAWLHKAAFYACSNARDLKRTRSFHESRVMQMVKSSQEQSAPERAEVEGLLDEGLLALTKAQREVLVLRFFENMTLAEVARTRRQSLYATQKALDAGLAGLRRFLSQRGVTVSAVVLAAVLLEESAKAAPAGLAASVGGTAAHGTAGLSGHTAELVLRMLKQAGRTKLMAALAGAAACLVLGVGGIGGLAFGAGHLRESGGAAVAGGVKKEKELSAAEKRAEEKALWGTLHETDVALRRMDQGELDQLVAFTDVNQARQWEGMAPLFAADPRLKEAAAKRFGAEGWKLTAIETFGERLDEVLPQVDGGSCWFDLGGKEAALHFGYQRGAAGGGVPGGTIYFVKSAGRWKIDAGETVDLALEGVNAKGRLADLGELTDSERALVWEKMGSLEGNLRAVRERIDRGQIGSAKAARGELQASDDADRAFFRIDLRTDDAGQPRE